MLKKLLADHTRKDFSAKMSIAYKEARETGIGLILLRDCSVLLKSMLNPFYKISKKLLKLPLHKSGQ
jgi:four helix bundle protein